MKKPDIIINQKYLHRWYLIPRNRFFNIYLHKFIGSDFDRALHDHPWWSVSFLLKGKLKEHFFKSSRIIKRFIPVLRSAKTAHRLELLEGPAVTLFITGPVIRTWGFYSRFYGWVPHKEYLKSSEYLSAVREQRVKETEMTMAADGLKK